MGPRHRGPQRGRLSQPVPLKVAIPQRSLAPEGRTTSRGYRPGGARHWSPGPSPGFLGAARGPAPEVRKISSRGIAPATKRRGGR